MFTKTCEELGYVHDLAYTLRPSDLGVNDSGWTIQGKICEDWYEWVNEFEATHPDFGRVWGNYETEVHADSEAAFKHFYANHPANVWDYGDI